MDCPKCGGKTIVLCTVTDTSTVDRQRKCISCGKKFYTKETMFSEFSPDDFWKRKREGSSE